MAKNAEVKRKHFRFPAYDDELGVKLKSENKRVLFQNEAVGKEQQATQEWTQPVEIVKTDFGVKAPTQTNQKAVRTQTQAEELAKHKSNLPDYSQHHAMPSSGARKRNLFGSMPKQATRNFRSTASSSSQNKASVSSNYSYDERSYFVPKYIPASVIPEEKAPDISEEELIKAMKKKEESYLLFDDSPTSFQVKEDEEDSTVKKFNIPSDQPEIPVTRRQYQQIKPTMERFGKEENYSLPRSRKELKSAKVNAKSQTPYDKKVADAEAEKKKGILDQPLSNLIEDSSVEMSGNKYFN